MADIVLALNAGSSSIKFAVFPAGASANPQPLMRGQVENIGHAPHLTAKGEDGAKLVDRTLPDGSHEALLGALLGYIEAHLGPGHLQAAGHRVVHGGTAFTAPVLINDDVLDRIEALTPLAPLHQPHNTAPIRALASHRPGLPQVACFDTAFHHNMPAVAARFALPRRFEAQGIRRYGFHGISYEFIARRLKEIAPDLASGRVIVAHLGNGASLCAMDNGRSIDTTMSFTALDGLVMGTRCGRIDPGLVLHLITQQRIPPEDLLHLLYEQSGLKGVSGISNDMRQLLASDDPHAKEAVDLFVFTLAREAGGLASSLGGLDGFVFTAGIGEHAAPIRAATCERLKWLGLSLDPAANAQAASVINFPQAKIEVRIVPTDEEAMIALHTMELLGRS